MPDVYFSIYFSIMATMDGTHIRAETHVTLLHAMKKCVEPQRLGTKEESQLLERCTRALSAHPLVFAQMYPRPIHDAHREPHRLLLFLHAQEQLTRQIWACRQFVMGKMSANEWRRESLHLSLDHVTVEEAGAVLPAATATSPHHVEFLPDQRDDAHRDVTVHHLDAAHHLVDAVHHLDTDHPRRASSIVFLARSHNSRADQQM